MWLGLQLLGTGEQEWNLGSALRADVSGQRVCLDLTSLELLHHVQQLAKKSYGLLFLAECEDSEGTQGLACPVVRCKGERTLNMQWWAYR